MASTNNMTVSSAQILEIADRLAALNEQLTEKLADSKAKVNSLSAVWTGEAATTTIEQYNKFATKFFEEDKEVIDAYIQFLRTSAQNYDSLEGANKSLAESFM